MTDNIKWFDRQFDFSRVTEDSEALIDRLRETEPMLRIIVADMSDELLNIQPEQKWSVKEHVGHLTTLEPLWQARIVDIVQGKPVLTPADLDNRATFEASFNRFTVNELIDDFKQVRSHTLQQLASINIADIVSQSLHPRMQQHLSLRDHLYFVAEHDLHHIKHIRSLLNSSLDAKE